MPNVAGVEFDYTPEGMEAAEVYRSSLGFRPLEPRRMQEGGDVGGDGPSAYSVLMEMVNDYGRRDDRASLLEFLIANEGELNRYVEENPQNRSMLDSIKAFAGFADFEERRARELAASVSPVETTSGVDVPTAPTQREMQKRAMEEKYGQEFGSPQEGIPEASALFGAMGTMGPMAMPKAAEAAKGVFGKIGSPSLRFEYFDSEGNPIPPLTAEAAKGKKNFIVDEEGNPLPVPQLRPLNRRYGGKVKKMRGDGIMSLSNNRGY